MSKEIEQVAPHGELSCVQEGKEETNRDQIDHDMDGGAFGGGTWGLFGVYLQDLIE